MLKMEHVRSTVTSCTFEDAVHRSRALFCKVLSTYKSRHEKTWRGIYTPFAKYEPSFFNEAGEKIWVTGL